MNWIELKNYLLYLSGDKIIISIFEIAILAFLVFVIIKDIIIKLKRRVVALLKRGETSWGYLTAAFGILSLLSFKIVNLSEFCKGHKVIITLFNEISFLYLCYFSCWCRNKIISLYSRLKTERR